ncbi:type VI secretion system baseplate subunit TssE [Helicobacter sp.]|uniref:GPW/gp25 family protein n=1 Tax=Helicobacter sp. TaxID=218 RepID=UPI0025C02DB0|nr:type VI secretion system baseplate subunit TssE [Helicobacter sp.]MBR2494576.1 GPW/gp25 family protein [Helicobacter sp.]
MSLLGKIIHHLDDQCQNIPFYQNEFDDIRDNIQVLLNTKLDDCMTTNDLGLSNIIDFNLNSSDLCIKMAEEIHTLIGKYEQRIRILSIHYDNSLSPWQILFFLQCNFFRDHFKEFSLKIVFRNDRYCEVI